MLFNRDIVFIHIGKTGGMSCAHYLLSTLRGPVYNCHVDAELDLARVDRDDLVAVLDVNRHCTLEAAAGHIMRLTGESLADKEKILAVIRHPYTLEHSLYKHLRKPRISEQRKITHPQMVELAQGDFRTFVRHAGYHRDGLRQQDYFLINGVMPDNVELIKYECLAADLPRAVSNYVCSDHTADLPHFNRSETVGELEGLLDEETRALIYEKHRYMFDHGFYHV